MNPDEQSFLDKIISEPDDDTHRLVYADWLEESAGSVPCWRCCEFRYSGTLPDDMDLRNPAWLDCRVCEGAGAVSDGRKELAELIRLSVQQGLIPEPDYLCVGGIGVKDVDAYEWGICTRCRRTKPVRCPWHAPDVRIRELLASDAEVVWRRKAGQANKVIWRRGFVEGVRIKAHTWVKWGDEIRLEHPVRDVTFTTRVPRGVDAASLRERLVGDPLTRTFPDWQVDQRSDETDWNWELSICRLRWPGVEFRYDEVIQRSILEGEI